MIIGFYPSVIHRFVFRSFKRSRSNFSAVFMTKNLRLKILCKWTVELGGAVKEELEYRTDRRNGGYAGKILDWAKRYPKWTINL